MQSLKSRFVCHRAITISTPSSAPLSFVKPSHTRPKLHTPRISLFAVSKSNFSSTRMYQGRDLRKMLRDTGMSEEQATRTFDKAENFATVATVATVGIGFWAVIKGLKWVFSDGTEVRLENEEAVELARLKEKVAALEMSESDRGRYS